MTPIWVTIVVGVAAGLGSGLIGTLFKLRHDRQAEVRRRAMDAAEAYIAAVRDVSDLVGVAIERRMGPGDEEAYEAAAEAIRAARRRLDPLMALVGPDSRVGRMAAVLLSWFEEAHGVLDELPPELEEEDYEDLEGETEEEREEEVAAIWNARAEESEAEARLQLHYGRETFREFTLATQRHFDPPLGTSVVRAFDRLPMWLRHPIQTRRAALRRREDARALQAKLAEIRARRTSDGKQLESSHGD